MGRYGNSSVTSLAFCVPMLVTVWVSPALAQAASPALSSNLRWAFAFDVGAEMQVGDGYDYVRSVVMVFGDDATGIELDVSGADAVFDEEDVLGAAVEDVEAAFFVPFTGRFELVALQEFDGDDLEGLVGEILRGVGEGAGDEDGFAVLKFAQEWRLCRRCRFQSSRRRGRRRCSRNGDGARPWRHGARGQS